MKLSAHVLLGVAALGLQVGLVSAAYESMAFVRAEFDYVEWFPVPGDGGCIPGSAKKESQSRRDHAAGRRKRRCEE